MMAVRCAWCKRDMGETMGPDGTVTDGICGECKAKEEERMRVLLDKGQRVYLDLIASTIYKTASINEWPSAVIMANDIRTTLNAHLVLPGAGNANRGEYDHHAGELVLRGPLAVELVEDGE